jgi:hypothetical protein
VIDDEIIAIYLFFAVALAAALAAVNRWPAVLAIFALGIVELQLESDLRIAVLGFQVSPSDLLASALALAGGWRFLAKRRHDAFDLAALALFVVLALFFARGAAAFGVETAANGYRRYFYLSAALLYLVSFAWSPRACDALVRLVGAAGVALVGLALALWAFPEFDLDFGGTASARIYEARRVLPANSAMLIAQVGMVGLVLWVRGRIAPGHQITGAIMITVMILLYHRSVWVTLAVTILALAALNWRIAWRVLFPAIGLALAFALVLSFGVGFGRDEFFAELGTAVREPLSGESTFDWRVEGWQILLRRTLGQGPVAWFVGSGFGIGYDRFVGNALVITSPHNFYVETFVVGGFVALALWLAIPALALWRLWRAEAPEGMIADRNLAIAWLIMILFYSIPYSPSPEQAALIAMAVGLARGAAVPVAVEERTA